MFPSGDKNGLVSDGPVFTFALSATGAVKTPLCRAEQKIAFEFAGRSRSEKKQRFSERSTVGDPSFAGDASSRSHTGVSQSLPRPQHNTDLKHLATDLPSHIPLELVRRPAQYLLPVR